MRLFAGCLRLTLLRKASRLKSAKHSENLLWTVIGHLNLNESKSSMMSVFGLNCQMIPDLMFERRTGSL